jgi:hypothetical protein
MKIKYIAITILFLIITIIGNAQPLPPTTPLGNPVPFGSSSLILLAAGGLLVFYRKKNKKE